MRAMTSQFEISGKNLIYLDKSCVACQSIFTLECCFFFHLVFIHVFI